jgi:hypothetical protein
MRRVPTLALLLALPLAPAACAGPTRLASARPAAAPREAAGELQDVAVRVKAGAWQGVPQDVAARGEAAQLAPVHVTVENRSGRPLRLGAWAFALEQSAPGASAPTLHSALLPGGAPGADPRGAGRSGAPGLAVRAPGSSAWSSTGRVSEDPSLQVGPGSLHPAFTNQPGWTESLLSRTRPPRPGDAPAALTPAARDVLAAPALRPLLLAEQTLAAGASAEGLLLFPRGGDAGGAGAATVRARLYDAQSGAHLGTLRLPLTPAAR